MTGIVGREAELALVDRLLAEESTGLRSLLIEGEAGIGKTTLWNEAMRRAAEKHLVLTCRPSENETSMPYVALTDLLSPLEDDSFQSLPPPQRRALAVALVREDPGDDPLESRVVAAGVTTLLARLSRQEALVLGIDDVQWLDRSTEAVLTFAMRRLGGRPITLVVSRRLGERAEHPPLGLDAAGAVTETILSPLDLGGLFHLIRRHLDRVFPRPTLLRIWEASGGVPLFALEMARIVAESGIRPRPGEPLPVPSRRADVISQRLGVLSDSSRQALVAVALLSSPTLDQITAAIGDGALEALQAAERAGIVDLTEGTVRLGHQLYASVLLGETTEPTRREMHRRLAEVVATNDARVHHLALGAEGPDGALAANLEKTAGRAERRGAPEVAAELYELACDLSPPADIDGVAARRIKLAELASRAGDTDRAMREVELVLGTEASSTRRAEALDLKARLLYVAGTAAEANRVCDEALGQPNLPRELTARLLALRAIVRYDDREGAEADASAALTLLDQIDDPAPALYSMVVLAYAECEWARGRALPMELIEQGLEMEAKAPTPTVSDRLSAALGAWLKYRGDFSGARRWLEHTHRAARDEGDEGSLPYAVSHLPQLELWSGDWAAAERWAVEHVEMAERTGQASQRIDGLFNLALVKAHRGQVAEASEIARQALLDAGQDDWSVMVFEAVLGFIDLSLRQHSSALEHLAAAVKAQERIGLVAPTGRTGDHAEALIAGGDLEAARPLVELIESRAREANSPVHIANALRCRALLESADQQLEAASRTVEEALANHDRVTVPFDQARTLLVEGMVLRRRGERRAAADSIEEARRTFRKLGAPLWERHADAELARIPIKRNPDRHGLTEGEMRVAALVAEGLSNKAIASELFISPKTVEANLSRVYSKLGIRSRAALASWMTAATEEPAET